MGLLLVYSLISSYRLSGKKLHERDPRLSNSALKSWFQFWANKESGFFSGLYREDNLDITGFSGASLFGLAIASASSLSDEFQGETLRFVQAAAQASCLSAKGLLIKVSRACSSVSSVSSNEGSEQERIWPFEAAVSGSFTALWQLR